MKWRISGWEGGDDWIRAQFKAYLISLLHTVSFGGMLFVTDLSVWLEIVIVAG
jgi:hypothetical protein